MRFQKALKENIPQMVALVNACYRGDSSRLGWTTEADLLDGQRTDEASLLELMKQKDSVFLLGFDVGAEDAQCNQTIQPVDQIRALCHLQKEGDFAWFGMFSVQPNIQNQGIGKKMLLHAEQLVQAMWKISEMRMTVISVRKELLQYYARRGYLPNGEKKDFPHGDERFGIPKQRLEMIVIAKNLKAGL